MAEKHIHFFNYIMNQITVQIIFNLKCVHMHATYIGDAI